MPPDAYERLFGFSHAFDRPITGWMIGILLAILIFAPLVSFLLRRAGMIGDKLYRELIDRIRSWWIIAPMLIIPLLLGAFWIIMGIALLSIASYREFARATGLFRHRAVSALVVVGILAVTFAVLDHWYHFFVAIGPLTISILAAVAILRDQPQGYLQRVGLAVFAFLFIGMGLGHLAYFANDADYRPILLWLIAAVELNDVFAFICGKTLGRRKLAPNTSPNKTLEGAAGAMILTTAFAAIVGHFVFRHTSVDRPQHLVALGLIISAGGILGDLMLSSIKRDLGIKDMGTLIPGHGGLLDRVNSLLLVAPAVFHYIGYFQGIGLNQSPRIISGG